MKPKTKELDLHFDFDNRNFYRLEKIIKRIASVKDTVIKININNQGDLKVIPSIIGECVLLEELDVSSTPTTRIPDYIFSLPNFRSLSCNCNHLSLTPAFFRNAAKLEKLELKINKGQSISEEICLLTRLKYLKLFVHSTVDLPENLGSLKSLEEFELEIFHDGRLERKTLDLPESFAAHPALRRVKISFVFSGSKRMYIYLAQVAQILASCPCFESLSLSNLSVGEVHKSLCLLTGLKELELEALSFNGNPFESIAFLRKLEKLAIHGDRYINTDNINITELPDIFGNLPELQKFVIENYFV